MRKGILRSNRRSLGRGAALLLVAGVASGCSSQMSRFNGPDDIFTGSTANQRAIINHEQQPYPGDVQAAAPIDPVSTGTVDRNVLSPVTAQPLPAPVASVAAPAPVRAAAAVPFERKVHDTSEFARPAPQPERLAAQPAVRQPAPAVAEIKDPPGWSSSGGVKVPARAGDTINGLSKRYGVPAKVLAQVNGMPVDRQLQAGQKIIVPSYVHAQKQDAAAARQAVADAAVTGAAAPSKVPLPTRAPEPAVAVLPQKPKLKDQQLAAAVDSATGTAKPAEKVAAIVPPKPEAPKAAAAKAAAGAYTVQPGDTLSRISRKTGVSVAALKAANGMQDGVLQIGQTVKVPAGGAVPAVAVAAATEKAPKLDTAATASIPKAKKLAEGEAVTALAPSPAVAPASKVLQQAEAAPDVAPAATGIGKMRWPVNGRVISGYGKGGGKSNDGIDIAVPEGTAVKAAENGVVIYAGDGLKEFGNTVLVRHDDGLVTVYGNASELKVQRGQKVKRGEQIAVSGMSGSATAPKLHFEVRKNSAPVDPGKYLE
ncbi:MAG: peptidoglycan DD-metalloendopeptidase family protein [Rhizobiaceae bacterium]|nr:peptidoglycan DD-metalloendopeptidase family protein [Rhizobiaceae bacterium]